MCDFDIILTLWIAANASIVSAVPMSTHLVHEGMQVKFDIQFVAKY